ncbi:hypothetical protein F4818DRAFT_193428 [Hypoxylon cercidicola]|nr:hypothetical protein F4818DRAFT_193428 [Hypoxylon cercidicola]
MNRQGRDIVHYLLGLPGISREPLWDNSNLVSFLAKCIIDNQITLPKIQEWASVCRFVEVDFNISDCDSFLTRVIYCLSDVNLEYFVTNNRTVRFDTLIQQKIGCDQSADTASLIPVAYAAFRMTKHFQLNPLDGNTLSPTSYVQYRGYYAAPNTAECVDFLEHVISRGITERPDCIFDTYRDVTVSDWFYHTPWQHIWEEILEEHGFDVRWVYDEDERRKRVITGETSAHEVSVGTDASATQSTRRRRGYENSGD